MTSSEQRILFSRRAFIGLIPGTLYGVNTKEENERTNEGYREFADSVHAYIQDMSPAEKIGAAIGAASAGTVGATTAAELSEIMPHTLANIITSSTIVLTSGTAGFVFGAAVGKVLHTYFE